MTDQTKLVLVPENYGDDVYDPGVELEYSPDRMELYVIVGEEAAAMAETVPGTTWNRIVERLGPQLQKGPFQIEDHTTIDKRFRVMGPGDLVLYVDYDDVNHDEVDRQVEAMVARLNDQVAVSIDAGGSQGDIVVAPVALGLSERAARVVRKALTTWSELRDDADPEVQTAESVIDRLESQLQ